MKHIYTAIIAGALLIMPACNSSDTERVRAAGSATQPASTSVLNDQRDDYVKTIEAKLDEFDQQFDGLDARTKAMTGTAKNAMNESIKGLRDQRQAVAKKLNDVKSVSVDSWLTLKAEVDTAVADLQRGYEQVSAAHDTTPAATRQK